MKRNHKWALGAPGIVFAIGLATGIFSYAQTDPVIRLGAKQSKGGRSLASVSDSIVTCSELSSYNNASANAAPVIQGCISRTPSGGVVELPAGIYTLANPIITDRSFTLRTQGKTGTPRCDYELGLDCAVLKADPNFNASLGLINVIQPNITLDHIVLDGNRETRITSPTGAGIAANCGKDNSFGYNANVNASNFTFVGSVSKNAICGSALGIYGDNHRVMDSTIARNGDHRGPYGDGLTVTQASNSRFTGNLFVDNTDVAMVFGGCSGCVIQGNVIQQGLHYRHGSFAALLIHAWPSGATNGNYTNADVSGNRVDCSVARRCGFGMLIGADPWYQANFVGGGEYHDNTITNAQEGFIVDRSMASVHVYNNTVQSSAGGTQTNCGFRGTESYNVSPTSVVNFAGDSVPRSSYLNAEWKGCIANFSEYLHPALTSAVAAQMYQDILGRAADSAGLAYFSGILSNGTSVSQLWTSFALSAEAASVVGSVYRSILSRTPSSGEISGWQGWLADGHTLRQMRGAFILSPEGQARLRQAMITALGHSPSPAELQSWGTALLNGGSLPPIQPPEPTASASIATSFSILKLYEGSCDVSRPVSGSCNTAVNRLCREKGYHAGGFGPVQYAGDAATITCVSSAGGQASQIATSFTELRTFQPPCTSADPTNVFCNSAINHFCASRGFGSAGFGPFETSGDSTIVTCAKAPRADSIWDTFSHLATYHPACTMATVSSGMCKSAIDARCKSAGYVSGYGILEYSTDVALFSCVR